jgi:excinuclease UvrABC nuclease subunit
LNLINDIPVNQGLYLFHKPDLILYVGETENLQKRIRKHLDHSDNKELAKFLWEYGQTDLHLEIHVLPEDISNKARKALETELIRSRKPFFNIGGKQTK